MNLPRLRIVEIENYVKRNSTVFITRDYTTIKLIRLSNFYIECIYIADARRIVRGLENSASASLLIYSDYALQECSLLNVRHVQRSADACNKIGTHRGYSYICSELSQTAINLGHDSISLQSNSLPLVGTVLYNAIKEYHDDGTRKTIYFHGHTIEDNYNAICEKTSYSNKEDIEANEREEETRVRLRELSRKIHDILLREFRRADNFTESVIHNDDEQDEFAILAEKYTIDNCIIYALALTKDEWELELEDCNALVERYEEEINCSDLYSTV
ncbi:hypothetical protein HBI12_239050 [Parastagonospora nodorum]|nr:hypothetical protein HBI12_239050 [Parastagonospora nodorum]